MHKPVPGALLQHRLNLIKDNSPLLSQCLRGIERECLRVTQDGSLARTPHPKALGSALTHALITTDYSESLLEFVTAARNAPTPVLKELDELHRFVYSALDAEYLWSSSMPCVLPTDDEIPIGEYGSSNAGRFKNVYRRGLGLRYGRAMQCIAGIHYNFSLPEAVWPLLHQAEDLNESDHAYQSSAYMALIRNFQRYCWLLIYLFGASPALNDGFLSAGSDELERFDAATLYLPFATSLRMSDLGYQSRAQATIDPCLNSLTGYVDSIRMAVQTPYQPYGKIGTHVYGERVQLNTNILQLESEYYAHIRPKRIPLDGERPLQALNIRGVQYVEVRCLDINPFLPMGIDAPQARFLDVFLLFCALDNSPPLEGEERRQSTENILRVAKSGRHPSLELHRGGKPVSLQEWSHELLARMTPVADLLDCAHGGQLHRHTLSAQETKVDYPSLTPSAQVLAAMNERDESFNRFALRQSQQHAEAFRAWPLSVERQELFETLSRNSLDEQLRLERQTTDDFDLFVEASQTAILRGS